MSTCASWRKGKIHLVPSAVRTNPYCMSSTTVMWWGMPRDNIWHDSILSGILDIVHQHIPSTSSFTVDIGSTYNFPLHNISTNLQPDLVWWDEARKHLTMVELTVFWVHIQTVDVPCRWLIDKRTWNRTWIRRSPFVYCWMIALPLTTTVDIVSLEQQLIFLFKQKACTLYHPHIKSW